MAFKKVEIDTWKPQEANESIEGIFIKEERDVGTNSSMLYSIEAGEKPVSIWGSAILDPKMVAAKVGDLIKIEYLGKGEAKGGHNAPKLYDVYIDYEHRAKNEVQAPVAAVPTEAAPATPVPTEAEPVAAAPAVQAPTTPAPATA